MMREGEIPVNLRDDGKVEILLGKVIHVITISQAVELANKLLTAQEGENDKQIAKREVLKYVDETIGPDIGPIAREFIDWLAQEE